MQNELSDQDVQRLPSADARTLQFLRLWLSNFFFISVFQHYRTLTDVIPIGQRPFALLDSSKSINIKSISTAATVYLMSTALQNCKINCLYSVSPGKLEVIMLIALINLSKSYVLFHCHNIDHSNNNNR